MVDVVCIPHQLFSIPTGLHSIPVGVHFIPTCLHSLLPAGPCSMSVSLHSDWSPFQLVFIPFQLVSIPTCLYSIPTGLHSNLSLFHSNWSPFQLVFIPFQLVSIPTCLYSIPVGLHFWSPFHSLSFCSTRYHRVIFTLVLCGSVCGTGTGWVGTNSWGKSTSLSHSSTWHHHRISGTLSMRR